jgi:hypothetical protein
MIRYRLNCSSGHSFEAWFQNSAAYERQAKRGLVECPTCGTNKVQKALMAPSIAKGGRKRRSPPADPIAASEAQVPVDNTATSAAIPPQMLEMMRKIRREVQTRAEYVGPRFAEEARKIHHKEVPERGIYGEASPDDVRALRDDGVECYPLPTLPEDHN